MCSMKYRPLIRSVILSLMITWLFAISCDAQTTNRSDLPNILWITSEDNSAHWLGCYGNTQSNTPCIDGFAKSALQFQHAYSNSPVCAVARSTLLTGCYAVTMGTQHMRSRYPVSSRFKPYVGYLKNQGYYCTNNSKTDYNIQGNDKAIWDACSRKAHYRDRETGQPFFAIFNITVSHESSLFPERVDRNRKNGLIPKRTRIDSRQVSVPGHLPDLPEVRQDIAIYHDNISALDSKIGEILEELESAGLANDTIVFYYSDHGGPIPRSKRYLFDTGVRVPLLIRIPDQWNHLSTFEATGRVEELVSFVDFAPTLLSLCGVEIPQHIQGRPFLGLQRVEPANEPVVFLYGDRFDGVIGMRRGITDGRFKYIRRFMPHLPSAPYSNYSLSMPSWSAWQNAWKNESLKPSFRAIWESPQPVEMLFDTTADPWEINNLANDIDQILRLARMRNRLKEMMISTRDTGVIPESLFQTVAGKTPLHEHLKNQRFDFQQATELVFLASDARTEQIPELIKGLKSADPIVRYWSLLGCQIRGEDVAPHAEKLQAALADEHPAIRIAAAQALLAAGISGGRELLLSEFENAQVKSDATIILLINAIKEFDAQQEVPEAWVKKTLEDKKANQYARRFAKQVADAGGPQ